MTPKIPKGVTIEVAVEQDDLEVRGNVLAIGDRIVEREEEDRILKALAGGNIWAWSRITVTARFGDFAAVDTVGGCSYADGAAFLADDLYEDMAANAVANLKIRMKAAVANGKVACVALKALK